MKFDKENLLKSFECLPETIELYLKNIPEELIDKKRTVTAWSIREHVYHIASVQEMLYQRMLKIENEQNPVITPYFPEDEPDREFFYDSLEQALIHYKEMRRKQISLINQFDEAVFDKEATHNEYIRYNIPLLINHMIFHEYWHMYRIEELWLTKDEYL